MYNNILDDQLFQFTIGMAQLNISCIYLLLENAVHEGRR